MLRLMCHYFQYLQGFHQASVVLRKKHSTYGQIAAAVWNHVCVNMCVCVEGCSPFRFYYLHTALYVELEQKLGRAKDVCVCVCVKMNNAWSREGSGDGWCHRGLRGILGQLIWLGRAGCWWIDSPLPHPLPLSLSLYCSLALLCPLSCVVSTTDQDAWLFNSRHVTSVTHTHKHTASGFSVCVCVSMWAH